MNEFELSTLIVVGLLLLCVGGYSYAQIFRAQKQVKAKRQIQVSDSPTVPVLSERYHSQVQAPMASDDSAELTAEAPAPVETFDRTASASDAVAAVEPRIALESDHAAQVNHVANEINEAQDADKADEANSENSPAINIESEAEAPTLLIEASTVSESESVGDVSSVTGSSALPVHHALDHRIPNEAVVDSSTPSTNTATAAPITSMQELAERAAWAVFAPWMRVESWLNTAYPEGVDVVHSIDGVIDITIAQPKVTQDIENALFDLQLNTQLPIHLYGARAGRVTMDANRSAHSTQTAQRTREWEPLEVGAPYSALRLSLQLANRSHCVDENLLQDWFALAEKLRKRLAGQIERLPDATQLADYARYLHAVARRLSQPIIVQLHKKNGLWPAYEIHQQLSACGAVLNEHGVYVISDVASGGLNPEKSRVPIYTVMNDVNNPRALDFFRDQMAMMHVHTLSFCLEFARVNGALKPLQRMCEDVRQVADALDAQWQNAVGDAISPEALFECMDARASGFNELLKTLGLPAGALMTKRLLAQ
ncbi:MAG: hypothetical protein LWW74_08365 [Burkholderiales bacterium]|nr:hypothetical protein [Burkholderiales bacterium]